MSKLLNLDDRISSLVPDIDPSIREELQRILQTLRRAEYPIGVIQMMSRLALRLFRRVYEATGHPFPSDNLFDVIVRAAKGDPEKGVRGYGILPDALDSPLHTLRVLSNKVDHGDEQFPMGVEEAELVLNAFLSILKWFHCESGLTARLPSIYSAASVRRSGGRSRFEWHVFVSHNRRQMDWVTLAVAQWRQLGLRVYFDEGTIQSHEHVDAIIDGGIAGSRRIVLLLTPMSVADRWVALEAALKACSEPEVASRRIVPVMLERITEDWISPHVRRLRIMDLTDPSSRRGQYHALLRSLDVRRSPLPEPPPWPGPFVEQADRDDRPGDVGFTLHIDGDFGSFSDDVQERVLAAVKSLLMISRSVTVIRRHSGSVYLTIRLRRTEAEQLLKVINAGALREHGVVGGEIVALSVPVPSVPSRPDVTATELAVVPEKPIEVRRKKSRVSEPFPFRGDEGSVTRLIGLVATGEQEAAQKLWERYYESLVRIARTRLRESRPAAADVEDTALSAFASFFVGAKERRFPDLNDRRDLWMTLIRITIRKTADRLQSERRLKRGGGKVLREADLAGVDSEPTPEFAAMAREELDRLLNILPDPQLRTIASLKLEGYTDGEIAEKLGVVRRTIARKLGLIRSLWGEESQE